MNCGKISFISQSQEALNLRMIIRHILHQGSILEHVIDTGMVDWEGPITCCIKLMHTGVSRWHADGRCSQADNGVPERQHNFGDSCRCR